MYTFREFPKKEKPYKFLTLSFDDGVKQDERFIKMLDERGLKCTFNINTGLLGNVHNIAFKDGEVPHDEVEEDRVAELYRNHEVAVHTLTHPRLDLLDEAGVIKEVGGDADNIARLTGQEVVGMAYPGGPYYTDETIRIILANTSVRYGRNVKATYDFGFPENYMDWPPTCYWRDEKCEELIKRFAELEPTEDCILYVWGHSYEFDMWDGWDHITRLLDLMAGHDDITYATNGEIYKYRNK